MKWLIYLEGVFPSSMNIIVGALIHRKICNKGAIVWIWLRIEDDFESTYLY